MSDEIILNDNDGSSNILEYIEITNSGTGTLDATKDIVILEDYNPNVPVIRPPYIAEDIANKKNNLDKLLFGLGIRHVGAKTAKILAQVHQDIFDFINLTMFVYQFIH